MHKQALAAARAGRPGAEGVHVGRDVEHAVGGHDGARGEGELHRALDLPARDIDGQRDAVGQAEILLGLVAGGRIGVHGDDGDTPLAGCDKRNAGVADGVRDADGLRAVLVMLCVTLPMNAARVR